MEASRKFFSLGRGSERLNQPEVGKDGTGRVHGWRSLRRFKNAATDLM